MHSLELKIPPPAVALVLVLLMWLAAPLAPSLQLPFSLRLTLALVLALIGQTISVSGGVYRFTRNPMYLGLSLMLLGWSAYLANPLAVLFVPIFILYMNRFQIQPEERAMHALFGEEYACYTRQVRRWI
ncbi:MAG: isoprenylcysteine carboxylmethyltransferase family protein [Burkholderiales bacterium]|nr:isoprenylcysteine carboxylmethyltransferase family protein [Burkholderiales bacterium]